MDEIDQKILVQMQNGIALTPEPFNEVATRLGISQKEVVSRLAQLKLKGEIRRFGASIKPNAVGFSANALVAWKVPVSRIKEVGFYLSGLPEISHCYERRSVPQRWEYNLYTVIHARERRDIESMVEQISVDTSLQEYKILFSKRNLKRRIGNIGDPAANPKSRSEKHEIDLELGHV